MKNTASCAMAFERTDETKKRFERIKSYVFENYEGQNNKIIYSGNGLEVHGKNCLKNIRVKLKPKRIVIRGNDTEIINNIVKNTNKNN